MLCCGHQYTIQYWSGMSVRRVVELDVTPSHHKHVGHMYPYLLGGIPSLVPSLIRSTDCLVSHTRSNLE
jgi:hypothetical protein